MKVCVVDERIEWHIDEIIKHADAAMIANNQICGKLVALKLFLRKKLT